MVKNGYVRNETCLARYGGIHEDIRDLKTAQVKIQWFMISTLVLLIVTMLKIFAG